MNDFYEKDAKRFVELYYQIYLFLLKDYKNKTGKNLKTYKEYEPDYLKKVFLQYKDKKDIIDQASSLTSNLIVIQAFPNANHRTAFLFMKYYLKKQGITMDIYSEKKEMYNRFYEKSKFLIERPINHKQLFNESYMDVQHSLALKEHEKSMKRLMKEIVHIPQSGITTVESFHSFVASINQSGSLPFLNQ